MDAREERGLAIAAKYNLTKKGDAWLVPSQSENGEKYIGVKTGDIGNR